MSTFTWEEILRGVHTIQEVRYAIAAMYGLQLYEWFASFDKEVNLIHQARWSSIKVAYLLCRYYPLCFWPVFMWAYIGNHSSEVCEYVLWPIHALLAPFLFFSQGLSLAKFTKDLASYFNPAVMVMRAYAFSGRNRWVLIPLATCYSGLLAVDIWAFCIDIKPIPPSFYTLIGRTGCFPNYGDQDRADAIGYSMQCRKAQNREVSLARYFISQGLSSFGFIAFTNATTAVCFFRRNHGGRGVGLPLVLVSSNLVACRVILLLRRKASPTQSEISRRNSNIVHNAFKHSDVWTMDPGE
ncbi:uncharacterized protein LACBIDRAFT_310756 [Laccaria bicolor S238N-H82]|uniref:Predicted protein n=1 Tax=Laccaria bicolor (strain S238N-H82 / ATCC MYA-4686) TaxID=486041 RepID=B0DV14_LACBS|nr:uncharacterized protein LACBIDRAFT_310756 [Laccaria bicolor S238N-H82]EDR01637.1 predicted protein [Laccaria bicolor S238N-H82]|eukprot:XP_001887713.1 predicted protein [Laccaria bicolor S238N-H82]